MCKGAWFRFAVSLAFVLTGLLGLFAGNVPNYFWGIILGLLLVQSLVLLRLDLDGV